jgi:hypothetical protein
MVERHRIMLDVLQRAIDNLNSSTAKTYDKRARVLMMLRGEHHIFVRAHMYVEAWCTQGLISMIDDSPTVNDVWRELRCLVNETPHSNRGVTLRTASSLGETEIDHG